MFSKFKPFQGPSNYTWKDPDTGRLFAERSKEELISRIEGYRKQNSLEPIEHLSIVLENYWCGLPENRGRCDQAILDRGFLGYLKGGVALLKRMAYLSFAPQDTADRRALQCTKCRYNVFPDREQFVKWSDDIAEASTLGRRSRYHDELGSCEVCTCPLRAKVWINEKIKIEPSWEEPMKSVGCWQLNIRKINGN